MSNNVACLNNQAVPVEVCIREKADYILNTAIECEKMVNNIDAKMYEPYPVPDAQNCGKSTENLEGKMQAIETVVCRVYDLLARINGKL